MEKAIAIENLSFVYAGSDKPALSQVNLSVEEGEFVLMTGASGSGKSTLLRALVGLIPHSYPGQMSGSIRIFGLNTLEHSTADLATKVGLLFQNPENQLFSLSVEDDVSFGLENLCLPPSEITSRVDWALQVSGMESYRQTPPFELSGGQQQRVAIASVLSMRPRVLVFDEPTSFLDPRTARNFVSLVHGLNRDLGITVIVVEQKLEQFMDMARRVIILDEGRVVADGETREVFEECVRRGLPINVPVEIRAALVSRQLDSLPIQLRDALREVDHEIGGRDQGR